MATKFWDKIAPKYASQKIDDIPAYEQTLDRLRELLNPDDNVLEIGCGTGSTALVLSPHVAQYIGADLSRKMLDFAQAKLDQAAPPNLRFVQAAADEPIQGAPFDAVIASSILHLVPDLNKTLSVLHSQLKPQGLLITKTSCVAEMNPIIRVVIPLMRLFGKAPYVNFLTRHTLSKAIEEAGFEVLEVRTFGTSKYIPFILARKP